MNTSAIQLSPAEIQSGHDRVQWAEGLIVQLPQHHDGRNSWLLNYGTGEESDTIRAAHARGIHYGAQFAPVSPVETAPLRRDYRLSDADLDRLLSASKPVPYLIANGFAPTSPRDAVMHIWREIADREGVSLDSIRQGSDGNGHYTAIAAPPPPEDSASGVLLGTRAGNDVADREAKSAREALRAEREMTAVLLAALTAMRDEMSGVEQWWGTLREAVDAADVAIAEATGILS